MNIFDLYTDYLQITPGLATATGLSNIVDKAVSHDQVKPVCWLTINLTVKTLWHSVNLWLEHMNISIVA